MVKTVCLSFVQQQAPDDKIIKSFVLLIKEKPFCLISSLLPTCLILRIFFFSDNVIHSYFSYPFHQLI